MVSTTPAISLLEKNDRPYFLHLMITATPYRLSSLNVRSSRGCTWPTLDWKRQENTSQILLSRPWKSK